jgi:glycosyltransferase involved in cell wall biosynthesis
LERYKSRVREVGLESRFIFTGLVGYNDLPEYYKRLSIFVAPVWRESFGQVSPFAMSMRIPVVGFDVGALNEIIGDQSLLAPPGDIIRLADIIIELLDNRSRRLEIGIRNAHRARELFSVQAMCDKYSELYEDVLHDFCGRF